MRLDELRGRVDDAVMDRVKALAERLVDVDVPIAEFARNLWREAVLDEAEWSALLTLLAGSADEPIPDLCAAVAAFCDGTSVAGCPRSLCGPVAAVPGHQVLGRLSTLERLVTLAVRSGAFPTRAYALDAIEAVIQGFAPPHTLGDWPMAGGVQAWATFDPDGDDPFAPEPLQADIWRCLLGLDPAVGEHTVALTYVLPPHHPPHTPTILAAYGSPAQWWNPWFRAAPDAAYGRTHPWEPCTHGHDGRPEVVHQTVGIGVTRSLREVP